MRPLPPRALLALLLIAFWASCGGVARPPVTPSSASGGAAIPLATDDDVAEAINEYHALPADAPERAALRAALVGALAPRVRRALAGGADDAAFESFEEALGLWSPEELAAGVAPSPPLLDAAVAVRNEFAREGKDVQALTALVVLQSMRPGDRSAEQEIDEAARWSDDAFVAEHGPGLRGSRLVSIASHVARDWPSPFVVEKAASWYAAREQALRMDDPRLLSELSTIGGDEASVREAYGLARLYLRAHRLADATRAVAQVAGDPVGDDPPLRAALAAASADDATPDAIVTLAKQFSDDRDVALDVCLLGTARFPEARRPLECAAAIGFSIGRTALAVRLLEKAVALDPTDRETTQTLLTALAQRLGELETCDGLARVDAALASFLSLGRDLHTRFPTLAAPVPDADAYQLASKAYFNAGDLARGRELLDRSVQSRPTLDALEQLGQLELKTGRAPDAVADFERAARLDAGKPELQQFDAARMLREEGDAYAGAGDEKRATVAYRMALTDWDQLFGIDLTDEAAARGFVERGRILYALGQVGAALQAFDHALAAKPARIETYVDELAFLVPRGQLPDALTVYHAALAQPAMPDYFRAYTTFWLVDLARIEGAPPDPLAMATLDSIRGASWQDDLARYHEGEESAAALAGKAATAGERAELYFYESLDRERAGDHEAAETLWRKVLGTGMVDYIEYDMAQYFLAHGAPHAVPPPVARPAEGGAADPGASPSDRPRDDGSI